MGRLSLSGTGVELRLELGGRHCEFAEVGAGEGQFVCGSERAQRVDGVPPGRAQRVHWLGINIHDIYKFAALIGAGAFEYRPALEKPHQVAC
jgi:hypothetical protein